MGNANVSVYTSSSLSQGGGLKVGASGDVSTLKLAGKAEHYRDLPTIFREGASATTALTLYREREERQHRASTALARPEDIKTPAYLQDYASTPAVASGVRKLSKSFKSGERIVQRKIGWEATPATIVVVTVERELEWRPDGKLQPAGEWLIEHRRTFHTREGVAEKRVGRVAVEARVSETTSTSYVEAAEEIPDAFVAGADAMSFLPLAVRGDVVKQVKIPTYFDGRILGTPGPAGELKDYEVSLLRMDDDVALVVHATRKVTDSSWKVMQAKYLLGTPEIESA